MKTVFRILGVVMVLIALLACTMSISRANADKEDAVEMQAELAQHKTDLDQLRKMATEMTGESKTEMDADIAKAEKALNEVPTESTYLIVQVLLLGLLSLAVVFAIFLFRPNLKLALPLLLVSVALLLAAYLGSPSAERGKYSGLPSNTLALISGIPVVMAGLFSFLVARKVSTNAVKSHNS
ncbi:MAG TPA: hypothetical protein VF676_01400 [Flavobacterium sp.]|jgi:hypothetical protein